MNRPPAASSRIEASMNSPVKEFRTTSTPLPPAAARNRCSNPTSGDEALWSSGRPSDRSTSHFAGLAVANTSAPRWSAIWTAAIPTPPAAACTRTDSPARSPANSLPVQRREERDRHGGGLVEAPLVRHSGERPTVDHGNRPEPLREQAEHPVPRHEA